MNMFFMLFIQNKLQILRNYRKTLWILLLLKILVYCDIVCWNNIVGLVLGDTWYIIITTHMIYYIAPSSLFSVGSLCKRPIILYMIARISLGFLKLVLRVKSLSRSKSWSGILVLKIVILRGFLGKMRVVIVI